MRYFGVTLSEIWEKGLAQGREGVQFSQIRFTTPIGKIWKANLLASLELKPLLKSIEANGRSEKTVEIEP